MSGWKALNSSAIGSPQIGTERAHDAALNQVRAPEQQGDPTHQVEENDCTHSGLRCSNIDHAQKAIILEYAAAPHGFSRTRASETSFLAAFRRLTLSKVPGFCGVE
jgi:hypothetical protein